MFPVEFMDGAACCVVMASKGYPGKYTTGYEIKIPDDLDAECYIAGGKINEDGKLVTSGGRVLGVVATAGTLEEAVSRAYSQTERVTFENAYYRKDIGKRALAAGKDE